MGMNDFYLTLVFDGAEIQINNLNWKICGQTFISKCDVHNIISDMSNARKVKENLYSINGNAELYLHINDNNDVVGIEIKDSFDNLEKDVRSLYEVCMRLKKLHLYNAFICDEQCEIGNETELADHIKRIYKDKYLFYQRSKKHSKRSILKKLFH